LAKNSNLSYGTGQRQFPDTYTCMSTLYGMGLPVLYAAGGSQSTLFLSGLIAFKMVPQGGTPPWPHLWTSRTRPLAHRGTGSLVQEPKRRAGLRNLVCGTLFISL